MARRQAVIGGFILASSPSPSTFEDESDDGSGSDGADELCQVNTHIGRIARQ